MNLGTVGRLRQVNDGAIGRGQAGEQAVAEASQMEIIVMDTLITVD